MLQIRIDGLDELRRQMTGFSDRRFDAAIATALTRAGKYAQEQLRATMQQQLDRPTPYTLNALRLWPARADKLEARVGFRDDMTGGVNANHYLMPNVQGGARVTKRIEVALRAAGALPEGWLAVPGQGAALDAYGNMSRGQVIQILSQLRITLTAGYSRNIGDLKGGDRRAILALRKAGGRFFVVAPGAKIQPGVYQRELLGQSITPVLIFVRSATYRQRYRFFDDADRIARDRLPEELRRAFQEQAARLAAKSRA